LRSLQEDAALRQLLEVVTGENARLAAPKPILLKVAPDVPDEAWPRIAAVCEEFALAGIIATNTTLNHFALAGEDEAGGLSGVPLRARSTKVIELLRRATALPIIGVGGISDPCSAQEKLRAGANLLQVYTALIYRGPRLLGAVASA
jgi:dihydroorotate dehydrogenase